MRFCMECGHELEPGTRFCTSCGAPVAEDPVQTGRRGPYGGVTPIPEARETPRGARRPAPVPAPPTPSPVPMPDGAPGVTGTPGTSIGPKTVAATGGATTAAPAKSNRMWIVVTAAVAAVALVAGLAFAFVIRPNFLTGKPLTTQSATSDADAKAKSGSSDSRTKAKSDAKDAAKPDAKSLSSITDKYSSTDVSVSAMFLGDGTSSTTGADYSADDIASTAAARTKFVSAGLYLPVYVAARADGGDALTEAQNMMSTMSNDAANQAMTDLGGFDAVNRWLSEHGYADTTIGRDFGDVAASNAGYENYSSTFDAVRMLAAVDAAGASDLMNVDVAAEGVAIPTDMTIHAHRGQGIKNTWNYFAVVTTPHGKAAVALATQNQGKATAAQIMSDVLADIDSQLTKADE